MDFPSPNGPHGVPSPAGAHKAASLSHQSPQSHTTAPFTSRAARQPLGEQIPNLPLCTESKPQICLSPEQTPNLPLSESCSSSRAMPHPSSRASLGQQLGPALCCPPAPVPIPWLHGPRAFCTLCCLSPLQGCPGQSQPLPELWVISRPGPRSGSQPCSWGSTVQVLPCPTADPSRSVPVPGHPHCIGTRQFSLRLLMQLLEWPRSIPRGRRCGKQQPGHSCPDRRSQHHPGCHRHVALLSHDAQKPRVWYSLFPCH